MVALRNDTYTRGTLSRPHRQVSGLHFMLMFAALSLLMLSRLEHSIIRTFETAARDAAAVPLKLVSEQRNALGGMWQRTRDGVGSLRELRRLRHEVRSLRAANIRLKELERQNLALARLVHLIPGQPAQFLSARVIGMGAGPFRRSYTIDAGERDGLRVGLPVSDDAGVLGRILSVGRRTSHVLLTNDINSRLPVFVGPDMVQAIAGGDNSDWASLLLLPRDARIKNGDVVTTSGGDGVLPRGMVMGLVRRMGSRWMIVPGRPRGPHAFVRVHKTRVLEARGRPMLRRAGAEVRTKPPLGSKRVLPGVADAPHRGMVR